MKNEIEIYTALCDVSLNSIVGWSRLTVGQDDEYDGTIESARKLFESKHPLSRGLLIHKGKYYTELVMDSNGGIDIVESVRQDYVPDEYRFIDNK